MHDLFTATWFVCSLVFVVLVLAFQVWKLSRSVCELRLAVSGLRSALDDPDANRRRQRLNQNRSAKTPGAKTPPCTLKLFSPEDRSDDP